MLFAGERGFSLWKDYGHIHIGREQAARNHPSNVNEKDSFVDSGVFVSSGVMLSSRRNLHLFQGGSVTGIRYCTEIILPYVRVFRGAVRTNFLFMNDKATLYRTGIVTELWKSEAIQRKDCPIRSQDLIKNAWNLLGRHLVARDQAPTTIPQLQLALQKERDWMSEQILQSLVLSMDRRIKSIIAIGGAHILY